MPSLARPLAKVQEEMMLRPLARVKLSGRLEELARPLAKVQENMLLQLLASVKPPGRRAIETQY